MSKEEGTCKVSSVYKHKERKPKKPHYIPRPWGKPYNYKCFQCPFTCMEKSHLYNHMKYSLCKNSLSLLIESDWPYKKGNLLHPELRLLQASEASRIRSGREDKRRGFQPVHGSGVRNFIITDVFSLKSHPLKSKVLPADVEAKQKQCKLPKHCQSANGILMEQWRLAAAGQRKSMVDISPTCTEANVIPCYPPPAYSEYQEPRGLNLSLLGINYPLSTSLFSYLGHTMAGSTSAHAHLSQLPFLGSSTHLIHPHSSQLQALQHADRAPFPPRFYYPLLFEHALNSVENKIAAKSVSFPPKINVGKVAALKTTTPWQTCQREDLSPDVHHKSTISQDDNEKWLMQGNESNLTQSNNTLTRAFCRLSSVSSASTCLCSKPVKPGHRSKSGLNKSIYCIKAPLPLPNGHHSGDLSKTLEEYQEVEKKLSDLVKEGTPGQKPLREQLTKIRRELSNIQKALEEATKQHDGPLDLSVKRPADG
uniref:Proline rich 35 n=1 Tax=Latimeria chalumnae TaxID=7897 RepID=H3B865_LATCH